MTLIENFRARKVRFGELAERALQYSRAHKLSYDDDVVRMKKLVNEFGSRSAESITAQDIERWFAEQSWKPATFNRYKALLSLVYRLAIENGSLNVNPAKVVKTRRENNGRIRFLSNEEESRLRQQITKQFPVRLPELDVALHTGMRRSEQYRLTWDCVDFERRVVTIPRSKHGETRYVFLNDAAIAALKIVWKFSSGDGRVFSKGYPSERSYGAREWFQKCLKDAQIANFTWHCLRHTFASNLVMRGVDIRTVQELMGHRTIQMTLRYAHLAPQHQLEAIQRLCDTRYLPTLVSVQDEATDTTTSTNASGSAARHRKILQ
jgi:site-specific recombinase XerD